MLISQKEMVLHSLSLVLAMETMGRRVCFDDFNRLAGIQSEKNSRNTPGDQSGETYVHRIGRLGFRMSQIVSSFGAIFALNICTVNGPVSCMLHIIETFVVYCYRMLSS